MAFARTKSLSKILSVFETVKADLVEFIRQEVDNVTIKTQEFARLNIEVAEQFIDQYVSTFDPENKDMWTTVLNCLRDDEDGQGYLFDHFKALETQIKHWMEKHRG
jgi:hypothetical protein